MGEDAAEQTLHAIISWGRYAEAFAYNDERDVFSLDNPTYYSELHRLGQLSWSSSSP